MNENKFKVQEFVAHSTRVNCLSFGSKSNQVLATGGEDMKVNIWRIGANWSNIWTLGSNKSAIECLCFDSEEQCVVSGSTNGSLKVFDLNEGKLARNLGQHPTTVHSIQYHPYGEFIVSGSADCTMKVWDVRSKTCIQTYNGHTKEVTCVRFSPDGKWVASSAMDGQILLWDLVAGKLIHSIKVQTPTFVRTFEFNPTEFTLAGATSMRSVKFWDLEVMESIGNTTPESNTLQAIAYSNLGSVICTAAKDSLKIWELDHPSVSLLSTIDTGWDRIGDLTISNNFQLIAGSCYSNFVAIYSIDLEEYLSTIRSSGNDDGSAEGISDKHRGAQGIHDVGGSNSEKRNSSRGNSVADSKASSKTTTTATITSTASVAINPTYPSSTNGGGSSNNTNKPPLVVRKASSSDYNSYDYQPRRPQDKGGDDVDYSKGVGSKLSQVDLRSDQYDVDNDDGISIASKVPLQHLSIATDAKRAKLPQEVAEKKDSMDADRGGENDDDDGVNREGADRVHVTWDEGGNSHEMATSMGESFWNRFKDSQQLMRRNNTDGSGEGGVTEAGDGGRPSNGGVADEDDDSVVSSERLLESLLPPSSYNVVKKHVVDDKLGAAMVVQAKPNTTASVISSSPSYADIAVAEEYTNHIRKPLVPSFPKRVQPVSHSSGSNGPTSNNNNNNNMILDSPLAIVGLKNGRNPSNNHIINDINSHVVESPEHKHTTELLDRLLQDSSSFKAELLQRYSSLRILRQLWQKGEVMETIDHMNLLTETLHEGTNSLITLADFLNAIELKGNGLSLDSCVRILPILDSMISTKEGILSEHVVYSVYSALSSLSDGFGELISSTRSHIVASAGGVDLTREARLCKCNVCHEIFSRTSAKVDIFKRQFRASKTTVDILDIFRSYYAKYFSR